MAAAGNRQPASRRENGGFPASSTQHPERTKDQPVQQARQIAKELTHRWPQIKDEMLFLGRHLTKWNLVKAIGILSEARKSRFLRRRTPKYGSMNKAFTDEELEHFFSVIKDPKAHLLFSFQAILGLRIGEAVRLNIKDINLKTRELRIFTEKSGKTDYLIIPEALFDRTIRYINAYERDIAAARGFLFFSFTQGRRKGTTDLHYTTETARKFFRQYTSKARLEEIYGYSAGQKPHELKRLTPHSLRHYAITNFCRKNGGNVMLAAKFARHTNLQITMTYIHAKKEELYESIERAQDKKLIERINRLQMTIE
ncbi:MAG: site-specific integrase [Candidatus Micrarchaeota archaeon]